MPRIACKRRVKPSRHKLRYNPQFWGRMGGQPSLFMPLVEGAGNPRDYSPALNPCTIAGGAVWSTGVNGRVLSFNGTTGYVSVPFTSALKGTTFTYLARINLSASGSGSRTILGWDVDGGPTFRVNASNQLELLAQGIAVIAASTGTLTTGVEHDVAASYDTSGHWEFYIDGLPSGSGTTVQAFSGSQTLRYVGRAISQFFPGSISRVAHIPAVVSAAKIAALHNRPWAMFTRRRPRVARATSGLLLLRRRAAA